MFEDGDHVIEGYHFDDGDFRSGAGQDVVEVKDASLTMVSLYTWSQSHRHGMLCWCSEKCTVVVFG